MDPGAVAIIVALISLLGMLISAFFQVRLWRAQSRNLDAQSEQTEEETEESREKADEQRAKDVQQAIEHSVTAILAGSNSLIVPLTHQLNTALKDVQDLKTNVMTLEKDKERLIRENQLRDTRIQNLETLQSQDRTLIDEQRDLISRQAAHITFLENERRDLQSGVAKLSEQLIGAKIMPVYKLKGASPTTPGVGS